MSTSPSSRSAAGSVGPSSLRWWTGGRGFGGVAQWPNPAIVVWMLTVVLRWTNVLHGTLRESTLGNIGRGALLVWALDELVRGTSPIRRLMGLVVLAVVLVQLFA